MHRVFETPPRRLWGAPAILCALALVVAPSAFSSRGPLSVTSRPATAPARSVRHGPSSNGLHPHPQVVYDQYNHGGANDISSQQFEAAYAAFDDEVADDFALTTTSTVGGVGVQGAYFNGVGPAASVNVRFYSDAGCLPSTLIAARLGQPYTNGSMFEVPFAALVNLPPGGYWLSVQARQNFGGGRGQWGWQVRTVQTGCPAAFQNPGGGFNCPTWAPRTSCITGVPDPDQVFRLYSPAGSVPPEEEVDHFRCYGVGHVLGFTQRTVTLNDQFQQGQFRVIAPRSLCTPVEKVHGTAHYVPNRPGAHLLCYQILPRIPPTFRWRQVLIRNQFTPAGGTTLSNPMYPDQLCVPSFKSLSPQTPPPPPPGPPVCDAFSDPNPSCTVQPPEITKGSNANATGEAGEPNHGGVSLPLKSVWYHFTPTVPGFISVDTCMVQGGSFNTVLAAYTGTSVNSLALVAANDDTSNCGSGVESWICFAVTPGTTYHVAVDDFGSSGGGPYTLTFSYVESCTGPPQQPPDLDHYLCYRTSGQSLNELVTLTDQLIQNDTVAATAVYQLCNPVKKIVGTSPNQQISAPVHAAHLVSYLTNPPRFRLQHVWVRNQFGVQQMFTTYARSLAVPSRKTEIGYTIAGKSGAFIPGTALLPASQCDDCVATINPTPFPVNVSGTTYSILKVSSNGLVCPVASAANPCSNFWVNSCMPESAWPRMIAVHHDDLVTNQTGADGIYTATAGSGTNQQFIVEWRAHYFPYFSGTATANFEVIFNQDPSMHDGADFETHYVALPGNGTGNANGASATVGVQDTPSTNLFTQYECYEFPGPVGSGLHLNWLP